MRSQRGNPVVGQRRKPRPADLLVETLTPSRAPTPSGVPDAACLGAAHQSHSIPHASHSSYGSGHRDGGALDAATASPAHQDSERGRASGLSSHKSSVHGPPRSRKTPGLRDGLRYVFELHPRGSIDYSHLALTFPQILGSMHTGSAALCIGATLPPDRGSVQSDDVWPLPPPGSFTISAWPKSSRRRATQTASCGSEPVSLCDLCPQLALPWIPYGLSGQSSRRSATLLGAALAFNPPRMTLLHRYSPGAWSQQRTWACP